MIDPLTHETVGAGMIVSTSVVMESPSAASTMNSRLAAVTREQRAERFGHRAFLVWLQETGDSADSARATELESELFARGILVSRIVADSAANAVEWLLAARALLGAGVATIVSSATAADSSSLKELCEIDRVLVADATSVGEIAQRLQVAGWLARG